MQLLRYFETDDGSLPEIEVEFSDPSCVLQAFELLFACGAQNVTAGGGFLWHISAQSETPFSGSNAVALMLTGVVEPFHVVLGDINCGGEVIPDLGMFVDSFGLTLDYRMGPSWGKSQVESLCALLRRLQDLGWAITVPWWGSEGRGYICRGAE